MRPELEKFLTLPYEDRRKLRAVAKGGDTSRGSLLFAAYFPGLSTSDLDALMKDVAGLPDVWFR
jgi:hypothetical protein